MSFFVWIVMEPFKTKKKYLTNIPNALLKIENSNTFLKQIFEQHLKQFCKYLSLVFFYKTTR